jgi:hypothetical protein
MYSNMICRAGLALLILSGLSLNASAINLLLNPGFETGAGADADDWEEFGGPTGSTSRSNIMPNTGSFHAYMEVDHLLNTPAAVPYFIQQVQPVGSIDNTLNYDLSFSAKVDSIDFTGIDMFYQIQWLDQDASDGGGVKGETLTPLIPAGINTDYQQFSLNDIDVPDGADSFLLRFQLSPGPVPDIVNGLYIDDTSLSVVGGTEPLPGDANGDGIVDLLDLDILGANFGLSPATFAQGDFNADNIVDLLDLDILGGNFGATSPANAIPEPTTVFLTLAAMALAAGARVRS